MMTEPAAELRQMAGLLWQFYVAALQQGFNPDQALALTLNYFDIVAAANLKQMGEE